MLMLPALFAEPEAVYVNVDEIGTEAMAYVPAAAPPEESVR